MHWCLVPCIRSMYLGSCGTPTSFPRVEGNVSGTAFSNISTQCWGYALSQHPRCSQNNALPGRNITTRLDQSGRSVFVNMNGPAKVECNRRAGSTLTDSFHIGEIGSSP